MERGEVRLGKARVWLGSKLKEVDAPSQFAIAPLSNTLAVLYSPPYIWPFPYGSGLLHDTASVQYNAIISSRPFTCQVRDMFAKVIVIPSLVCGRDA